MRDCVWSGDQQVKSFFFFFFAGLVYAGKRHHLTLGRLIGEHDWLLCGSFATLIRLIDEVDWLLSWNFATLIRLIDRGKSASRNSGMIVIIGVRLLIVRASCSEIQDLTLRLDLLRD